MRTPGHDAELVAGFLFTEGIVAPGQIGTISHCGDADELSLNGENLVEVELVDGEEPAAGWQRNFYAASSCGICGKASIEAIQQHADPLPDGFGSADDAEGCRRISRIPHTVLLEAADRLSAEQPVFQETGGLHAAALFGLDGSLRVLREDVGRHNAVDKVIGHALLADDTWRGLHDHLLIVSGRTSFEIVQKALVARIPVLAGVSAASSLAVQLARESNMALAGFVRGRRLVVYAGEERMS